MRSRSAVTAPNSSFLKLFNTLLEKHQAIYSPLTKLLATRRHHLATKRLEWFSDVSADNILAHQPAIREPLLEHYGNRETVFVIIQRALQASANKKIWPVPAIIKKNAQQGKISIEEVKFIADIHGFLPDETKRLLAEYEKSLSPAVPVAGGEEKQAVVKAASSAVLPDSLPDFINYLCDSHRVVGDTFKRLDNIDKKDIAKSVTLEKLVAKSRMSPEVIINLRRGKWPTPYVRVASQWKKFQSFLNCFDLTPDERKHGEDLFTKIIGLNPAGKEQVAIPLSPSIFLR